MALAQPTNLQAWALEPLVPLSQSVEAHVAAQTLVTLEQWTGGAKSTQTLVALDQEVKRHDAAGTLVALDQGVYRWYPAATLVTLDQTPEYVVETPRSTLVTLDQTTEGHRSAGPLARLRQVVLSVAQAAEQRTWVYLDGTDISAQCSPAMSINASEGDNRTASVRLVKLPSGPLSITSYQGRSVEIVRLIDGSPVTLFAGTLERPVYDVAGRSLRLECSDLRHERVGREDHDRLKTMTGGLYSPITQREDATGEQWVRELLKTVPGSLDYQSDGTLRYSPWAVGTPRYALTGADVHYRDIRLEFATRSEVVNRVRGTLEYRYYQRNTITTGVSASVRKSSYGAGASGGGTKLPDPDVTLPTRSALIGAVQSVSGWQVEGISVGELPPDGWYRDSASAFYDPVGYSASSVTRQTRGTSVSASLARYISQPRLVTYAQTYGSPESIGQFGVIDGPDMRFSVETRVDPAVFEERGCALTDAESDRAGDVADALDAMQAMAERQILASHRTNYAEFDVRAEILPVEIGDTISVTSGPFNVTGAVVEFSHTQGMRGERGTSIKLAVSRVEGDPVPESEWQILAGPGTTGLAPPPPGHLETPSCPAPVEETEATGGSRIEPDGTVVIVAPSIDRSEVDEIRSAVSQAHSVTIPNDTFTVEVP